MDDGLPAAAGAKYLTDEEALAVGKDNMRHSHATHDLYNAIDRGEFPEWEFAVQVPPLQPWAKLFPSEILLDVVCSAVRQRVPKSIQLAPGM